jgi:hypothetical protein
MTMSSPRVIIIGIGNPLRGDDGAGIAVAHHLKGQFTAEVKVIEEAGDGLLLLEAWRDASSVFLVDAMSSGSALARLKFSMSISSGCLSDSFRARPTGSDCLTRLHWRER